MNTSATTVDGVYLQSEFYALAQYETDEFKASKKLNNECAQDIDRLLNYFVSGYAHPFNSGEPKSDFDLIGELRLLAWYYGYKRVVCVLAAQLTTFKYNTICDSYTEQLPLSSIHFSLDNMQWADEISVNNGLYEHNCFDAVQLKAHPAIINAAVTLFRQP